MHMYNLTAGSEGCGHYHSPGGGVRDAKTHYQQQHMPLPIIYKHMLHDKSDGLLVYNNVTLHYYHWVC